MRRGTTPTVTATVDADLTGMNIYLAFKQSGRELVVKENADLVITVEDDVTTVQCPLSQADTLAFGNGTCEVQIRATKNDGATALATSIGTVDIERILQDGVLA